MTMMVVFTPARPGRRARLSADRCPAELERDALIASRRARIGIGDVAAYAIAVAATFVTLFPLYWLFVISTKTPREAFETPPDLIYVPDFSKYVAVWNSAGLRPPSSTASSRGRARCRPRAARGHAGGLRRSSGSGSGWPAHRLWLLLAYAISGVPVRHPDVRPLPVDRAVRHADRARAHLPGVRGAVRGLAHPGVLPRGSARPRRRGPSGRRRRSSRRCCGSTCRWPRPVSPPRRPGRDQHVERGDDRPVADIRREPDGARSPSRATGAMPRSAGRRWPPPRSWPSSR